MFWKYNFGSSAQIETLLQKEVSHIKYNRLPSVQLDLFAKIENYYIFALAISLTQKW